VKAASLRRFQPELMPQRKHQSWNIHYSLYNWRCMFCVIFVLPPNRQSMQRNHNKATTHQNNKFYLVIIGVITRSKVEKMLNTRSKRSSLDTHLLPFLIDPSWFPSSNLKSTQPPSETALYLPSFLGVWGYSSSVLLLLLALSFSFFPTEVFLVEIRKFVFSFEFQTILDCPVGHDSYDHCRCSKQFTRVAPTPDKTSQILIALDIVAGCWDLCI